MDVDNVQGGGGGPKVLSMQRAYTDRISHPSSLFESLIQEHAVISCERVFYKTDLPLNSKGSYKWTFPQTGQYLHGPGTYLIFSFKIMAGNDGQLNLTDNVSIVNLIAHAFVKNILLKIAHHNVPDLENSDVGYRSYIETVLSYGSDASNTHMK